MISLQKKKTAFLAFLLVFVIIGQIISLDSDLLINIVEIGLTLLLFQIFSPEVFLLTALFFFLLCPFFLFFFRELNIAELLANFSYIILIITLLNFVLREDEA